MSTTNTELSDFKYYLPHSTRFGDCDMYGHVNNVIYYSYYDTVINTYLIKYGNMNTSGSIVGLCAASNCEYKSSLLFPQDIVLALRTIHVGNTSVKYQVGIFKHKYNKNSNQNIDINNVYNTLQQQSTDFILCAIGTFVHVFVSRQPTSTEMKPIKIPDNIREALNDIFVKQQ